MCIYLCSLSDLFSRPRSFLPRGRKSREREREREMDRQGEREARQMSISTMHRWEGGNEGVINRRSQEISSLFLFLVRSILRRLSARLSFGALSSAFPHGKYRARTERVPTEKSSRFKPLLFIIFNLSFVLREFSLLTGVRFEYFCNSEM